MNLINWQNIGITTFYCSKWGSLTCLCVISNMFSFLPFSDHKNRWNFHLFKADIAYKYKYCLSDIINDPTKKVRNIWSNRKKVRTICSKIKQKAQKPLKSCSNFSNFRIIIKNQYSRSSNKIEHKICSKNLFKNKKKVQKPFQIWKIDLKNITYIWMFFYWYIYFFIHC